MWQSLVLIGILILAMGLTPRILGKYAEEVVLQNNPEDVYLARAFYHSARGNKKQAGLEIEKHIDVCVQRMREDFKKSYPSLQKKLDTRVVLP